MSKWMIKIAEVQKQEHGSFYIFELFHRTTAGVPIPVTTTPEPLILNEEHFHELTRALAADVFNGELQVLEDGYFKGDFENVKKWVRNVSNSEPGSFLEHIASAAIYADESNVPLMNSLLHALMEKYPQYA
jgi:hypothetical protein